ncbi:hypothetical protein FRB90_006390 [Tulasnella sp. 427]|nr:hypothetical protein FRB90_006390 [Tulasnella sp. 427]
MTSKSTVGPLHQIDSPKPLIVKVCPFTAPGGGYNAVGIFAFHDCHHKHSARDGPGGPPPPPPRRPHPPHGPPPRSPVEATIAIRFPKSSSADRLEIHDFSTELAGFHHHVPTLDIAFTKLTLVGSVEAAGIGATELAVVNIFGGIKGNFSASKELLLTSSSGPIEADVELWYGESEEGAAEPTKLSIIADRSYIRTNVSLLTYSSDTTPWYTVKTVASSDFARLNFTSQPLGSALGIETFSKDHPTNLYLHPAFEGRYEVNSVFQNPIVVIPEDTKDPYGEGRKRVVKEDKTWTPWVKKGSIEWVKESDKDEEGKNNPLGHIKMTTLKAPAELVLG